MFLRILGVRDRHAETKEHRMAIGKIFMLLGILDTRPRMTKGWERECSLARIIPAENRHNIEDAKVRDKKAR